MSEIKYLLGDEELFFAVYKISAEFRFLDNFGEENWFKTVGRGFNRLD